MKKWLIVLSALISFNALAGSPAVYEKAVKQPLAQVYNNVSQALEDNGFYVVFEPDIGKSLANFAEKWGREYNQNKLEGIRSMVFCSAWYANQVGNADPAMLALCPLHVTLISKDGVTTVLFVRPGAVAKGSPAERTALEIEQQVIKTIESGLNVQ